MGEGRGAHRILVGNVKARDRLEDLGLYVRIILKWIFKECDGEWTGLIWLRIGTGCGSL
jgi:hypothetical protein